MNNYKVQLSRLVLPLTAVLMILISIYSYRKLSDLINFNKQIERNLSLQKELEQLLSVVRDAETGQRGFMLTNDTAFSSTYFQSKDLLKVHEYRIRKIVEDDPVQIRTVDSLMSKVYRRIDRLNYAIIHRDELMINGNEATRREVMKVGKGFMEEMFRFAESIQSREEIALNTHQKETKNLQSLTPILLLSITLVSLLLIVYSYLSITRELNQKIAFEKDLQNKIEELHRSNSELEQFAYVASHDLQEPLRKIRSFGDRLQLRHAALLNEDAKSSIEKMQNAANRMQDLIDDLLSFSRLVNVKTKFENVSLNKIVNEVLNDLEVAIKKKNASIHVHTLPDIEGVPYQLRQVFQNLISNSLKFSQEGVNPKIDIRSSLIKNTDLPKSFNGRNFGEFYKIEIQDNGIGFDEKYLDRIFIIFQKLHGKMEYSGTGIGLAVTKKIMDIHRGYVTAESKPGEGSCFQLFFPAI